MAKIVLGLLLLAVSNCYASYVKFSSPTVRATLGGPVSLKCQSDENVDIFFKDAKITEGGRFSLARRAGFDLTLRISTVAVEDIGKYVCKSTTSALNGETLLQLRPNFPNDKAVYNKVIGMKAVIEFKILADPRPEVKYERKQADGTYVTIAEVTDTGRSIIGGASYSIDGSSGHLTINNAASKDQGEYKVEATQFGSISAGTFTLNVGAEPKITTPPSPSLKLESGAAATVNCVFESSPSTIKWVYEPKSGSKVDITGTTGVFSLEGTNLKISAVSIDHQEANLTCIGTNVFGSVNASTTIELVYVKPTIKALKNDEAVLGTEKSLTCEASGNPKPTVIWSKVNSSVALTQTQTSGKSVYTIAVASLGDAGTYQCVAVLAAKPELKDEASMTIVILTKPGIDQAETTKSVSYAVGKGETKDVKCVASGNPAPTITLTKGNTTLTGAVITADGNKVTAVLKHSANGTSDAGIIKCIAKNKVGEASFDITTTVIEKPNAPTGLQASNIERTTVDLSWNKVEGATRYKVAVDGKARLETKETQVTVKNLEGGRKYEFTVVAENAAGEGKYSDKQPVTTEKYDKPSAPLNIRTPTLNDPKISWDKPAAGGNDPSLVYIVEYCSIANSKCNKITTNETSVTLKLDENTDYTVVITAKNSRGMLASKTMPFKIDASTTTSAPKSTPKTKPAPKPKPESKPSTGLSGGAIAGIIIAVILILLIVIDLFCCFFNDCGLSHNCYEKCCAGKGKEGYAAADSKDVEKAELKEVDNDHEAETKTAPEEKEDVSKEKQATNA